MTTTILPETRSAVLPPEPPSSSKPSKDFPFIEEEKPHVGGGKLRGKVAIITAGDSGVGRSVAVLFAKEGANICIVYTGAHEEADRTMWRIEELGGRVIKFAGDLAEPDFCAEIVQRTMNAFGRIDIVVNHAAEQCEVKGMDDLEPGHVEKSFRANVCGFFYLAKAVVPHLKERAAIINTTSIQAYDPDPHLMVYASAKAAILNFTRSLARQLVGKKIRVNAVAPGLVWTPQAALTLPAAHPVRPAEKTLFQHPGHPDEIARAYLFLASDADSSLLTGQVLHVNGGQGMHS